MHTTPLSFLKVARFCRSFDDLASVRTKRSLFSGAFSFHSLGSAALLWLYGVIAAWASFTHHSEH